MTDAAFKELLAELKALGHELQGRECKAPGPRTDKLMLAKTVKAMLGMANRRDGGLVIIGITDSKSSLTPVGLSDEDLNTWNHDDLANSVSEYADPSINFELERHQCDGNNYVLICVKEFEDIPILCKKDYSSDIRRGACYVRSRRKPETTEISTQEDMRDLLDLAIEKRLRKFIAQAQHTGLMIRLSESISDQELFDKQLGDFYRG